MNKKKNYISFAEQSRRLIKKYSRASFDPSEKAELEEALAALAQEQEAYKQANQIGEYSPEAIAQKQAEQQAMQLQQMEQMQSQSPQGIPQGDPQIMQQQQGQPQGMIPSEMAMGGYLKQYAKGGWTSDNSDLQAIYEYRKSLNPNAQYLDSYSEDQVKWLTDSGFKNNFNASNYNQLPSNGWNGGLRTNNSSVFTNEYDNIGGGNTFSAPKVMNATTKSTDVYNASTGVDNRGQYAGSNEQKIAIANTNGTKPVLNTQQQVIGQSPETTIGQTQGYLPSIIGGASSMIGNLGMAFSAKPGQIPDAVQYSANYVAPEISLAKERERLTRNATEARNVAQSNARTSGGRGAYMAMTGVANAGINQQLSDSLSGSYFKEGMTNLEQQNKAMQENNRIKLMNQEAANQKRMMQFAENQRAKDEKRQYIASAIGNIGNIVGDFNKIGMNNANIESLGSKDYNVVGATGNKTKNWMLGRTIKGKVRK